MSGVRSRPTLPPLQILQHPFPQHPVHPRLPPRAILLQPHRHIRIQPHPSPHVRRPSPVYPPTFWGYTNPVRPPIVFFMKRFLAKLVWDDSCQDLIEYALVAALVGLLAAGTLKGLSHSIGNNFNSVGNDLTNAVA